jgi:hypothetical protein
MNTTDYSKHWTSICNRVNDSIGASYTRREFLRFAINVYPVPIKEFGAFFDEWVAMEIKAGRIVSNPPIIYDDFTFSKASLTPAPKADKIEVLSSTENLTKNVVSKH